MSRLAEFLINRCFKKKDPYLDLGNCGLTEDDFKKGCAIDDDLRNCTHLKTLILSNEWWGHEMISSNKSVNQGERNHFDKAPLTITTLANLNVLICGGFGADKWGIDDMLFVSNFISLRFLDLGYNKIKEIKGLQKLASLEHFNICSNEISKIDGLGKLSKLNYLNFFNNQISEIKNLDNLTYLEYLNLSSNLISEIVGLRNLVRLEKLVLYNNQIREIQELENLKSLMSFGIGSNQIKNITGLKNQTFLKSLDIHRNQIEEITGLEELSSLKYLKLAGNKINEIRGIDKLINLEELDLSDNNIREANALLNLTSLKIINLSKNVLQEVNGLEMLQNLWSLNISQNRIKDIKPLEYLVSLRQLNISNNLVIDIRPLIPFLSKKENPLKITTTHNQNAIVLDEINIYENPITTPPIEIARQGNGTILNYFIQLEKNGIEYLYEAKMLIVGQPRAGKTSLRDKLLDVNIALPTEDKTTRGIDIKRLSFNIDGIDGKSKKFYYNVWDFGGQQIYQTTHQFFLTHRSLYILVIDTSKDSIGNDDNTVNYWLQAVELLGGNSPMLLVKNEKGERQINLDLPQKRTRFDFLKSDYSVDLNALIAGSSQFNNKRFNDFSNLKEEIKKELRRLPLVGFPMPKNWVQIRNELQKLGQTKQYIPRLKYIEICNQYDVTTYDKQMELSRIFHDLGVFLHFSSYRTLEDYIILQNTWATDAVFTVFDNKTVQLNKGRFTDNELSIIWEEKGYETIVHNMLLALMMQFELCYLVDKSKPQVYIIPEMLSDSKPNGYEWKEKNDLPLQYKYDFMPRGILTRLIVRLNKYIAFIDQQQVVWKTGVKIDGTFLGCLNTAAELVEAWNNKQLNIRIQGPNSKDLMSKITFQVDELNNEFFGQINSGERSQKSKWYKMIPCNCVSCKNSNDKHFYDYQKLLEKREYGKTKIECEKRPFAEVNIEELLGGVFAKEKEVTPVGSKIVDKQTITIFLASSFELKAEREQLEIFLNRENNYFHDKGIFFKLRIWEDFIDTVSHTRLQDEYNKAIKACDVFVMLYFTKVGKYTAEEFEIAYNQFQETDKPKIYTYYKKGFDESMISDREATKSLWTFQDKLKDLGHFPTEFKTPSDLHLHFKKQLEKLYRI